MAFIVAFWNVQRWTANSDAHKTQVVTDTIKKIDAEVLFLEESHSSVEDIMSGIGYAPLGFVNTLTVDGNGTQLQITGWRKSASHVVTTEGRVLRMPKSDGVTQKRARLKVNVSEDGGRTWIALYAVHANASKGGGIAAAHEALVECRKGRRTVCGGDFNYDLNFDGQNLNITGTPGVKLVQVQDLYGNFVKTHRRGGILDFAIASADVVIASVPTGAYTKWHTIDHAPLIVKIG